MVIYLMRHAAAVESGGEESGCDAERRLTKEGREKTGIAARALGALECKPDRIISSPLARAVETAEIVGAFLAPSLEIELSDCLEPGAGLGDTVAVLTEDRCRSALLVGHMPHLSMLGAYLVSGHDRPDLVFKKGAVCCVSFDGPVISGKGALEWLLQPQMLKCVAAQNS